METTEDSDGNALLVKPFWQNPRMRNADAAVMVAKEGSLRRVLKIWEDLASGYWIGGSKEGSLARGLKIWGVLGSGYWRFCTGESEGGDEDDDNDDDEALMEGEGDDEGCERKREGEMEGEGEW